MSAPLSVASTVALEYIAQNPNLPSKTLARLLTLEEPALFPDLEKARRRVLFFRGQSGARNRRHAARAHGELFRPAGSVRDGWVPLPVPIGELDQWQFRRYEFDRALVISDVHVPFHDRQALEIALREGQRRKVDCIILNGDIADFYSVSKFEKDPRLRNFKVEVEATRLFLEHLRSRFKRAQIVYKEGNHEERLWRYALTAAPDFFAVEDGDGERLLGLAKLLDFAEYGIELVDNKQPILAGEHLYLLHGHEFRAPFQNPVNPARGLFLRAKCNALCGDLHQTSAHSEAGIDRVTSCWSVGCLCQLRPAYCPLNKWNHGFAVIELASQGAWSVTNHKIINGAVV